MSDEERQLDEIDALKWIYPQELIVATEWPASGTFKISPTLVEEELSVKIVTNMSGSLQERAMKVKYLPPIELYFKCPEDYPSRSQPMFMISCVWLASSKLTQICHQLDKLWDECLNSEILFSWVSFLKEDCCSFLQICYLCITLKIDNVVKSSTENTTLEESINQKNIKLRVLKNKRANDECENSKPGGTNKAKRNKYFRKTRYHRDEENFKYETPKDLEKKDLKRTMDMSTSESSKECGNSKTVTPEKENLSKMDHILQAMPVYGRRSRISSDFDSRVVPSYHETPNLVNIIAEYNDHRLDVEFRSQYHTCNICFEVKLGSACLCVKPCRHAFCKECIREYLTVNIKESQVQKLRCLDAECDTVLSVQQIKQNVDETTFEKYMKFSRKMLVQNDADLLYCPRKFCQGIARLDDKNSAMGFCKQCFFYFCVYCKRSYHGIEICKIKSDEIVKVIQEYQTAGPVRKAELEKRFTKQQLIKWVQDDLTEKLIKECSKPCPNCGALIEKNHGCNKMLCFNCNVPFCWLCNTCLSFTVPYAHYQNKESPCFEKLFPLQFENEDDDDFFIDDLDEDDELDELEIYDLNEALIYFSDSD